MATASEVPTRKKSRTLQDTRIAGLYDLEKTIGSGHFAVVKLARHVFTGERVACKIIDKSNIDPVSTLHIMQEVRCMKLVQHPNIVRLYEVIDTQTKLFLCLELGDYDMHDFIVKHEKGVTETLAQQYFCQIITAIDYCHRLHVVHRDLKPENVVFFEKLGMVKLTDFGFSNLYEPGQQMKTSCGSLAYAAPEILLGDAYDAPAVDVWSLGVILFMLVCGRLPFQETNDSETLTKILDCKYSFPDHLSTACKNLIQRMLVREPSKRASLSEIVANPWVAAGDRGHAAALPLIVQHQLPHSAHTTIIEQMVAGQVGTEDEILGALENDEYNSLTATYYLLAERILSTCREEKAKELMSKEAGAIPDEEPIEGGDRSSRPSTVSGSRCRSRSNSWRTRPCTILKEESEEELSTYLRSASRQSSRAFSTDRPPSTDRFTRQDSSESRESLSDLAERPSSLSLFSGQKPFEDLLSPIMEDVGQVTRSSDVDLAKPSSTMAIKRARFLRNFSEPDLEGFPDDPLRARALRGLVRRNSSPSVSMFGGSVKDRVSPQAVHDLLEFSRLGNARRAASPDSIRSSRSPSPPGSGSGRASPSVLALSSFSRLKVTSSATSGGGMRKLSSSPHLLGICEEGEEVDTNSSTSQITGMTDGMARTNRSASTGLVQMAKYGVLQPTKSSTNTAQQPTYSAVRMIRPRHAVVSPDVCRRYDQHQRFIARSRRSTSCSSSEASDDEEGKRLSLIGSKCSARKGDGRKDDDDKGDGGNSGGDKKTVIFSIETTADGAKTSNSDGKTRERRSDATECCDHLSVQQLKPILEMPQLDSNKGDRIRARLLQRSHTAERILRDWAGSRADSFDESWLGTPPREIAKSSEVSLGQQWIRQLQRTRSHEDLRSLKRTSSSLLNINDDKSVSDEIYDCSDCSSHEIREHPSDSGCSSIRRESREDFYPSNCSDTKMYISPLLLYDQPREEKVDVWLQSLRLSYT